MRKSSPKWEVCSLNETVMSASNFKKMANYHSAIANGLVSVISATLFTDWIRKTIKNLILIMECVLILNTALLFIFPIKY